MDNQLLFLFSSILLRSISAANDGCQLAACGPTEPTIRFPFRLTGQQPARCGYTDFDLSCNKQNRTIIRLPSSGSHIVNSIDYISQVMSIDPDFCQQKTINGFNLINTPFESSSVQTYSFYNCTQYFEFMSPAVPLPCLSDGNHSVIVVRSGLFARGNMPASCEEMKMINLPVPWNRDIRKEFELMWFTPACQSCESEGKSCGLKKDGEVGCLGSSRSFPMSAKFGLSLGIAAPISVCIMGLICYVAIRVRERGETNHQSIDPFSIGIVPQPPSSIRLDESTIESYPKTTLGESCRLPNDDSTCAICLSDYKPKESLRTIPECNHYFHVHCINEWLKLNATCPVCRNTPESSSLVTPCSSTSTTSSS